MRTETAENWYEVRTLDDAIIHIQEPHIRPFYRCNIWLVCGRERDLLIDSGSGLVSLCEQVASVRSGRILAVATHCHFDHIGSHHEFGKRAVHAREAQYLAEPDREAVLIDPYATVEMFSALPPGGFDQSDYAILPAPATQIVEDGDVLDLGDRHLEVIHTPGHSPGSIALWEAATATLFSGDTAYDGPLVTDTWNASLDDYVLSVERLQDLPVRVVHGGHFPSFGRDRFRSLLRAFLARHRV
ncbi:MAG: MBL fold metallo-hydrolase [Rhodospirillales bacterium]|nr:MBL fold metallo-hydrolase [Rhodospirillales bacterium]